MQQGETASGPRVAAIDVARGAALIDAALGHSSGDFAYFLRINYSPEGTVMTWFVSTSPLPPPGATEGMGSDLRHYETERGARDHAIPALLRNGRIEAGAVEGVQPQNRIRPSEAHKLAFSGLKKLSQAR
jgi:hypothetical protein